MIKHRSVCACVEICDEYSCTIDKTNAFDILDYKKHRQSIQLIGSKTEDSMKYSLIVGAHSCSL